MADGDHSEREEEEPGTFQRWAEAEDADEDFGVVGAPSPRIARIIARAEEQPALVNWWAARLDRWREFYNLEGRVIQYWIDYRWVLFAGVPGVLIFAGSLFVPELDRALGRPLGDNTGWVRLGMMLLGAYLIFAGWPRRTRRGETVEQEDAAQEAMRRARAEFHRRLRK